MYQKFGFSPRRQGNVEIVQVSGYLENVGGAQLKGHVETCLQEGILKFILDFRTIELISSPGVAALLDIASKIIDDFGGQLTVFGLDTHHAAVLEMSGFFFLATQAGNEAEALQTLQD